MSDDVLDDGLYEGGISERFLNPQNYRPPAAAPSQNLDQPKAAEAAFTGEFKIGKPRCASDNCPYAITGVSPAHCCKWCRNESGKHGKKCERSWHIPAPSEWEYNDWLVNGSPSKFALLLPNERDAFLRAGHDPQTYNTPPSIEQVRR